MASNRPRLILVKGAAVAGSLVALQSAFDVVEVENAAAARRLLQGSPPGSLIASASPEPVADDSAALRAVLENVGEGLGVVDDAGAILWGNSAFLALDERTRTDFVKHCRDAIEQFNHSGSTPPLPADRKYVFDSGDRHWELAVSPASRDDERPGRVKSVVGILWDITARWELQQKIDAVDAAGAELMRLDAEAVSKLDMGQRLQLLEQKISRYVRDLLRFDNFEIRLLDKSSNRLELVVAVGLKPMKIGEVMFAEAEGNGISGWVASSGRSYLCNDVRRDLLYREGLDNAVSSLTVPLRLHDEVIGVFNIESNSPGAFAENDRKFAEIFGRYVAMAMHILDLLVVERFTTNEQVAANVIGELTAPVADIDRRLEALSESGIEDPDVRAQIKRIRTRLVDIRRRIKACSRGPRTILAAEQELQKQDPDPLMIGKRVLVADDEPEIRETLERILRQRGCRVTVCQNGEDTIALLERRAGFDLIVSDIKMPDRNGYEVFTSARALHPNTPVILMTGFGYDPHHSIIRASQEGLQALLFKPFKASQLIEAITKAFGGGKEAGPAARTSKKRVVRKKKTG